MSVSGSSTILVLIEEAKLVLEILELGILAVKVVKAFGNTEVRPSTSIGVCK